MKKIFSIMAVAALSMGFTACEDIPSPYEIFDEIVNGDAEDIYYESSACYTGWNLEFGKSQTIQYNPWSQGSSYTQATGYQKWDGSDSKSNKEAEGFLVSPKFKTIAKDNNVVFSFDYCIGYAQNDKDFAKHTKLYVSKTYTEGAIDLAEWEEINWVPTHTSTDWTLANTGNIALPEAYQNQDNVHLAFWFYAPAGGSATFEIMNFVMETGVAGEQPGTDTPDTPDTPEVSSPLPYNSASLYDGWITLAGAAKNPWSQGNSYTQATGYQKWDGSSKSNAEVDGYLISPAINTQAESGEVKMAFDYCVGYANNDKDFAQHIKVYASSTADGKSFNPEEWKQLDWTATHTSTNWSLATEEIQLPAEFVNQENVHVAFWFYAPATTSSTFELKNFKMLEGKAGESAGEDDGKDDNNDPVVDGTENGGFENWVDGKPQHWTTSSSAGNATLKQSTDAHSGKYSVEVGGAASANKRLGRAEMTLEAGTYTMTFWAKAATSAGGSVRPGYVAVVDGTAVSTGYTYGDYVNGLTTSEWVQVTHTFDIPTTGTYSLVIMNSKNPGAAVLIDDFVLMKGDAKIISSRRRAARK